MELIPLEHQIQTTLIHYLRIKGFYVLRLNSGKFSVGEGRQRRFINGQEAGTPDLLALRQEGPSEEVSKQILFIEVKRPGKKPTLLQKAKMKELESYGATCIVATCIEDLTPYI